MDDLGAPPDSPAQTCPCWSATCWLRRRGSGGQRLSTAVRVCEQVRDALMAPLRELQSATHFRQLTDGCWAPCKPSERGAKKLSLLEVPAQALRTPPVTHAHFDAAAERCRAPPAGTGLLHLQRRGCGVRPPRLQHLPCPTPLLALLRCRPTVAQSELARHEQFTREFGAGNAV